MPPTSLAWKREGYLLRLEGLTRKEASRFVNGPMTDTFKLSAAKMVNCPFMDRPVVLVPALNPDVGLIHVHRADVIGNSEIQGITVADAEVAAASRVTIVTCEDSR